MLIIYLVTLFFVMPLACMQTSFNNKNIKNQTVLVLIFLILILIAGLRDTASISLENFRQSDEANYRASFDRLIGSRFSLEDIHSFEWCNYIITFVLANIFNHSQAWIFFYAFVTNFLFIKAINKYVTPFWLGIFLYLTAGLFFYQMNGTRSVMAAAILTLSIKYIIVRKPLKFFLVVMIAAGFHFSSWIMLPMYFFLTKRSFANSGVLKWIILSLCFMLSFNVIANFILPYTSYEHYLNDINSQESYGVNIYRVLIFSFVYIFILTTYKKIKNMSDKDVFFINNIRVLLFINIVSISYVYVHRFNELFAFFLICCLPKSIKILNKDFNFILLIIVTTLFFLFGIQQNWSGLYDNILFNPFR